MLKIRQQRTDAGKPTAFNHKGMKVDDKKLRRKVKENVRRDVARRPVAVDGGWDLRLLSGSAIQVSNSMYVIILDFMLNLVAVEYSLMVSFLNWNIPYGTMPSLIGQSPRYSASSPMATSTPSDIVVVTPTNNASSPHNAPSPFSRDQNLKATIDRAHMLMGGQHHALVKSMRKEERE